jgi:hypothetical protein
MSGADKAKRSSHVDSKNTAKSTFQAQKEKFSKLFLVTKTGEIATNLT